MCQAEFRAFVLDVRLLTANLNALIGQRLLELRPGGLQPLFGLGDSLLEFRLVELDHEIPDIDDIALGEERGDLQLSADPRSVELHRFHRRQLSVVEGQGDDELPLLDGKGGDGNRFILEHDAKSHERRR